MRSSRVESRRGDCRRARSAVVEADASLQLSHGGLRPPPPDHFLGVVGPRRRPAVRRGLRGQVAARLAPCLHSAEKANRNDRVGGRRVGQRVAGISRVQRNLVGQKSATRRAIPAAAVYSKSFRRLCVARVSSLQSRPGLPEMNFVLKCGHTLL